LIVLRSDTAISATTASHALLSNLSHLALSAARRFIADPAHEARDERFLTCANTHHEPE
jgi:hypothetical protein